MANLYKLARCAIYDGLGYLVGRDELRLNRLAKKKSALESWPFVLIHIPKNAGSTLAFDLYGRKLGHFSINDLVECFGEKWVTGREYLAVLREPTDRLVSAYRFTKAGGTADSGVRPISYVRAMRSRNLDYFVDHFLESASNDEFVFMPQSRFIEASSLHLKLNLFCVDSLSELKRYVEMHGANVSLEIKNSARGYRVDRRISARSEKIVRQVYKEDFELWSACQNER